jgi:hypothetical protein
MLLKICGLTHPLLNSSKAISNEVEMNQNNQFIILTGPNMAGKSTFLRSLGLVFVFANAGFPVFANLAKIPKVKLYSSMRTSDDLSNESSYFHAELTRLRFIMDALNQNQAIFILLDEILNESEDKEWFESSSEEEVLNSTHHALGEWIRNSWNLWDKNSLAYQHFYKMGLWHPDDISTFILRSYHRFINKKELDLSIQIDRYIEYWKEYQKQYGPISK